MKRKLLIIFSIVVLIIGGYINKNEELYFYITFTVNNNEVGEVDTIAEAPNFPLEKDE